MVAALQSHHHADGLRLLHHGHLGRVRAGTVISANIVNKKLYNLGPTHFLAAKTFVPLSGEHSVTEGSPNFF
jgi:hypothetical protein